MAMSSKSEAVFEYLAEEGFRPNYDDDGDIFFKYEGSNFIVIFKDKDPEYTSISEFINIDIEEDELFDVLKLINSVNSDYIMGKITLVDNDNKTLRLQVDSFGSFENFKRNFDRYLKIISQMERDFGEGYSEISN